MVPSSTGRSRSILKRTDEENTALTTLLNIAVHQENLNDHFELLKDISRASLAARMRAYTRDVPSHAELWVVSWRMQGERENTLSRTPSGDGPTRPLSEQVTRSPIPLHHPYFDFPKSVVTVHIKLYSAQT